MKTIRDVVRDLLDGRENDEQITVEVSLLWSLLDAPPDEERLARALDVAFRRYHNCRRKTCDMHDAMAREFLPYLVKAYREDTAKHRHRFTMLSSPPTCEICGAKAREDKG